jgi:endonuclease YncB( thermonuclease family)
MTTVFDSIRDHSYIDAACVGICSMAYRLRPGVLVLLLAAFAPAAMATDITGKIVAIADGDTLTILDANNRQTKIRLHQIDAPEKKQDYGQSSKQSLSDLAYGKQARVEVADIDRYGRSVGTVWVAGQNINLEQVKRGMAWRYLQYSHDPAYGVAEQTARENRIGLWQQPNPIPPWEFRHAGRVAGAPPVRPPAIPATAAGRCGEKRYCKEMDDCTEARYYLTVCGLKQLDSDGDGLPCESLCKQ